MLEKGSQYVAEVHLPTDVYTKLDFRTALPKPNELAISGGYWFVDFEVDKFGTPRSIGITFILEFVATNLIAAEDKTLDIAANVGKIVSLFGGSPYRTPRLRKLTRVGPHEGVLEQHTYYYLEGPDRLRQIEIEPYKLNNLIESVVSKADGQSVGLAIRWYGISISTSHAVDGFLACWIGLESIGAELNTLYHPNGPKAACTTCGNQSGRDRDKKYAGIRHIINMIAPEVLQSRSFQEIKAIRHNIAHGLRSVELLKADAAALLKDMQLCLGKGILNILGSTNSVPLNPSMFMPRDTEVRPDARSTILFPEEQIRHRPFYREWIRETRTFVDEKSRSEPNGSYILGAGVHFEWMLTSVSGDPEHYQEYVNFHREGARLTNIDPNADNVPEVEWRQNSYPPSWDRTRDQFERSRQSGTSG